MEHQMNDQIINFLTRKESLEDVNKLKEWLAADPAHHNELKQWLMTWYLAGTTEYLGKISSEDAYRRFMFRLSSETSRDTIPKRNRIRVAFKTIRRIAAIFIFAFLSGMTLQHYLAKNRHLQIAYIENIVPLGSKSEIVLPDNSKVWLNAGSKLRYPVDYGQKTRDIWLEGEGYFIVAKQAEKPFTVHTSLSNIRALGTEFNVKAYPDENRVETTLIKGKVTVEKGEAGGTIERPVLLNPGQKLLVSSDAEAVVQELQPDTRPEESLPATAIQPEKPKPVVKQLSPDIASAEVSWKERNWRIESEQLQDLAVKIERRYDVSIQIDEALKSYRFTGTIKDESLEQVLHAMQLTAPILYKVEGKMVYIKVDPRKMKSISMN